MNRISTILFFLTALWMLGCSQKTAEQSYADFINDPGNRIVQRISIGDVQASMKWMPAAYYKMVGRQHGEKTEDGNLYYFNARFEKTTGEKPAKEKMLYLDFDMQGDFVMKTGDQSLSPVFCQRIQNGISGSYEYMLAFEGQTGKESENGFSVIYNDKIFGIGNVVFAYSQDDLKKIPKLKSTTSE